MAMVVKHNLSAQSTLNKMNKNSNELSKSLKKVSSGMRINGAGDDASGFSISEKMRVQLRGLEQDFRNTQSGTSLLRVAEGAMSSTVDILRTLKEKALDSANDHNTDEDRAIIQKEIDQYVDQVDDNAMVQYNGMYLFDGQTGIQNETVQEMIVSALQTEWIENTLDLIEESYGISFRDEWANCKAITVKFVDSSQVGGSGTLAAVASLAVPGEKATYMELRVNMDHFNTLDVHDTANVNGRNAAGTGVLDRTIAHELTHAIMASSIAGMNSSLPLSFIEGAAELVHGIDDERKNTIMGFTTASSLASAIRANATGDSKTYAGGYIALRYLAAQGGGTNAMKKLMNVLVRNGASSWDGAIKAASNGRFSSWNNLVDNLEADFTTAGSLDAFLKKYCNIDLDNEDTGAITGSDAHGSRRPKTGDTVVPEGGSTTFWYAPESMSTTINHLTVHWTTDYGGKVGNKALQIGTKANQAIKFGFHDMRAKALGLKSEDGTKVSVATQYDANNAIRLVDQSLRKDLNEQTTIGALQSRLEHTANNLTTAAENVQKSESTIRDADMAKEMTEYTKNNVLLQAAQSMLSQANQNSSAVLSLLQ